MKKSSSGRVSGSARSRRPAMSVRMDPLSSRFGYLTTLIRGRSCAACVSYLDMVNGEPVGTVARQGLRPSYHAPRKHPGVTRSDHRRNPRSCELATDSACRTARASAPPPLVASVLSCCPEQEPEVDEHGAEAHEHRHDERSPHTSSVPALFSAKTSRVRQRARAGRASGVRPMSRRTPVVSLWRRCARRGAPMRRSADRSDSCASGTSSSSFRRSGRSGSERHARPR